jgi:hypothetical protein
MVRGELFPRAEVALQRAFQLVYSVWRHGPLHFRRSGHDNVHVRSPERVVKERGTCPSFSPGVLSAQVRGHAPRGCSSVGRAPALQAGGRGFESHQLHKIAIGAAQRAMARSPRRVTGLHISFAAFRRRLARGRGTEGDLRRLAGWTSRGRVDRYAKSTAEKRARPAQARLWSGRSHLRGLPVREIKAVSG